ncbi:MAG: hypothetical protein GF311_20505 [Candidatus Lokiarchaeota archaeon]|nr:hypothetical protein [Candidatus Lokiarchaeota archaeon]
MIKRALNENIFKRLSSISEELGTPREAARYSDEGGESGASELVYEIDAIEVLADAEFSIECVGILFDSFNMKSK